MTKNKKDKDSDAKKTPERQKMREQEAAKRAKNFEEVPYGYTEEQARLEASRCLQCKKALCIEGCPVGIDIPGFILHIREGNFKEAARIMKAANSLPAICGRVCPQEEQCEIRCILGKKGEPVAIGNLERFIADWEREHGVETPPLPKPTGHKIAVVGSGPAGLSAAGELAKMGHDVTIFEALHEPGGVLVYGIPEFRLPKAIVREEIDYLKQLGVKIETNCVVGKVVTIDELMEEEGFEAVFVGSGAGLPMFKNIPGENLSGVFSANEYLTRSNLMRAYDNQYDTPIVHGEKVIVIGGGNVAMDSARTALRLGGDVTVVYRRSRKEMPARDEEIKHAEQEGIEFQFLTDPIEILGNDEGRVRAAVCIRMELGEPDSSGRKRPVAIEGSEFEIECDAVIVALGNLPHPLIPSTTPGLKVAGKGTIVVDEESLMTNQEGVFAGGDIVTGAATVILAMGAGKQAAKAIDRYLRQNHV